MRCLRPSAGDRGPSRCITPGAGWGAKRWPPERYAAVAQGSTDRGFRVLVNAGPGEEHARRSRSWPAARHPLITHAAAIDRAHSPHRALHRRRHGAAAPGLRAGPAGGGHLRTDRSQPQRPLRDTLQSAAQPRSRRDHTRRAEPEAGLLTIAPEDVLRAADELLAEETRRDEPATPLLRKSALRLRSRAGSRSPAASACRWAF